MKVEVVVSLKNGVLDPQGRATAMALQNMGFGGVAAVRHSKLLELEVADDVSEAQVKQMCEKLLANTVIESYKINFVKEAA
jgi:phosphoribosylformylglycinamidine synthase subunit PurS